MSQIIEKAETLPRMELAEFDRLVHLIYQGALEPAAWREFLKAMTHRLCGNAAVLILRIPQLVPRVPQLFEGPLRVTYGGVEERAPTYYRHYIAMDPFVQLPEGRVVTMHDFVDPAELERSEYFRDYLAPMNMVYALGADLREKGRYHVRLRICRPREAGNFTVADCALVDKFIPHLKTAIRFFSELDVVRTERSFYAEAMDHLTLATLVLNEDGRILHANGLAEAILAERDGLSRSNDSLQIANHEDAKRFRELLSRAVTAQRSGKPGLVEVMRVRRPSGRADVGLVMRPSSPDITKQNEHLTASIAVFLSADASSTAERSVPSEVIQKLFGLTPKEAALALRLAAGESLQQASEALGISPNTARAHLRAIFAKTGVDRQASLVRVLLRNVAMLG